MNQDVKKRWVEALRDGSYEQGHGALRKGDTYCCLGVLCDIMDGTWEEDDGMWVGSQNAIWAPPEDLSDNIGLRSRDISQLMEMNDTLKKDFPNIADYIEENL